VEHIFSLLLFSKLQSGCLLAWLNILLRPAVFAENEKRCQSAKIKKYMLLAFNEKFRRIRVLIPLFSLVYMDKLKTLERFFVFLSIAENFFPAYSDSSVCFFYSYVLVKVLTYPNNIWSVFTYILT